MNNISAYCTAENYDLSQVQEFCQGFGKTTLHPEVVHLKTQDKDVFIFLFGAVVFWNFKKSEETEYLDGLSQFAIQPYKDIEHDTFRYQVDKKACIENDTLILPNDNFWSKMAATYAFAQSSRLNRFEKSILKTIETNKPIIEHLTKYGEIPLSLKEAAKKVGHLFLERSAVMLHTDALYTPKIFWEHADVEPIYALACHYLDLKKRFAGLKSRLDVVQELFDMLASELNFHHSYKLEWIIIALILGEIIMTLVLHFWR